MEERRKKGRKEGPVSWAWSSTSEDLKCDSKEKLTLDT